MKNTFLSTIALLITLVSFGQKTKSDIVLENTCDCLNKTETVTDNLDVLTQQLASCMGADMMTYYEDLKKEFDIRTDDFSESMSQIGEKLGQKLVSTCPKFMEISMAMMENEESRERIIERMQEKEIPEDQYFLGRVEKVKTDGLVGITVSGSDESLFFVWLEEFDGSERFESNPLSLKDKKVLVTYHEMMIYDGTSKSYVRRKIISGLEVE